MSPLPGTKVIPDDWSPHHRPTAEGTLTGNCRAERPKGEQDIEPGQEFPADKPEIIWRYAPCSVQVLTQSTHPVRVADSMEVLATHRVSVPIKAAPLRYKDFLTVIDNPDDEHLNGRRLTVLVTETGTTNWTRDYLCQERNSEDEQ